MNWFNLPKRGIRATVSFLARERTRYPSPCVPTRHGGGSIEEPGTEDHGYTFGLAPAEVVLTAGPPTVMRAIRTERARADGGGSFMLSNPNTV